jgi:hypothetical protein
MSGWTERWGVGGAGQDVEVATEVAEGTGEGWREGKWLREESRCNNLSPKKCDAFWNAELRFERFCAFLAEVGDPVQKPAITVFPCISAKNG